MSLFGSKGLKHEHFYQLKDRFDSIFRNAGKDPEVFHDYFRKEAEHISMQVLDIPTADALEKALEMIETSARFELVRKDVVRGLLDGTI